LAGSGLADRFEGKSMATFVFGMNLSLDGYVDLTEMKTGPALFRHWTEHVRGLAGSVYGRRMYEAMHYWDEDRPEWTADQREFATVWRKQPKWVVSRSLTSVGPNATLVSENIEATLRDLKARLDGEVAVCGPELAQSATDWGLIDEYRLYFHPTCWVAASLSSRAPGRPCALCPPTIPART
jgi:dihydrofolate reductase